MNFKKELSPSKPLLYSTQLPILRQEVKVFQINLIDSIVLNNFIRGLMTDCLK